MADGASAIGTVQVLPRSRFASVEAQRRRFWRGHLQGSEYAWALAFCVPYIAVFLTFVAYPVGFGIWMGSEPTLYAALFDDPIYLETVVNTALFLGIAINVKLFLALLLSGFFMRKGWWVKALLMIFVLPWAVPALPTYISIHWMLNGEWGLQQPAVPPLRHQRPGLADRALDGARLGDGVACLEVAAVLDRDPARRPDGDPVGHPGGGAGRRRHRVPHVRPRQLPAARQPLSDLHAALDDLLARRLQLGVLRLRRRAGRFDPRAGDARHPLRLRHGPAAARRGGGDSALPLLIPLVIILMRKFRTSQVQL